MWHGFKLWRSLRVVLDRKFIPYLSENIAYSTQNGKHLFLHVEIPDWVVLNSNGAYIVGLIDGKRTINDIALFLKDAGHSVDNNELMTLLDSLKAHGIINHVVEKNMLTCKEQKRKLHTVHIKLTDECNLHCKYCYAESETSHKGFFDFDKLKSICDEVKALVGSAEFTLSGGEPLLHPNALEFAEYLQKNGHKVHLLTNGTQITPQNAPKIAQLFGLIKISIDGSSEEINARTRNKGSFEKSLRGYELLVESNANVLVAMTVTQVNIHDVNAMTQKFGNRLTFQPFFHAGRGSENDSLGINGREYYEALANVEGVSPMGGFASILERVRGRGVTKCAMADAEISISENGDVYPCQMMTDEQFKGGNIFENSISEILNSDIFQKLITFSSKTNEGCKECPIKLLCGGACRARSFYQTGDVFINSDFCEYEKLAYINGIFENYEFR